MAGDRFRELILDPGGPFGKRNGSWHLPRRGFLVFACGGIAFRDLRFAVGLRAWGSQGIPSNNQAVGPKKKPGVGRASSFFFGRNFFLLTFGCAHFDFEVHHIVDELVAQVFEDVLGAVNNIPLRAVNAQSSFGVEAAFGEGDLGREANSFGGSLEGQVAGDGMGISQGIRRSKGRSR